MNNIAGEVRYILMELEYEVHKEVGKIFKKDYAMLWNKLGPPYSILNVNFGLWEGEVNGA